MRSAPNYMVHGCVSLHTTYIDNTLGSIFDAILGLQWNLERYGRDFCVKHLLYLVCDDGALLLDLTEYMWALRALCVQQSLCEQMLSDRLGIRFHDTSSYASFCL